ncbi:MAG: hypothetical protein ABI760_14995 [Ferruginibacter sp.]
MSLPVMDVTQYEGFGKEELLYNILLELRILTQQLSELPRQLITGISNNIIPIIDEPAQLRNETSLFFNN